MSELAELLERVKEATVPDRELDADLDLALRGGEIQWRQANYTMDMYPVARRPSSNHVGGYEHEQVPLYTTSIDAAVALVERRLPGVEISMKLNHPMHDWQTATIAAAPLKHVSGEEKTLPLAILAALLTALLSQE